MRRAWGTTVAAAAVVLGVAAPADAADAWAVRQLPLPGGATGGQVLATDYRGGFIGTATVPGGNHLVVWRDGQVKDIAAGTAVGVGDSSRAGVTAVTIDQKPYALAGDRLTPLPLPAGARSGTANGVNERGDVLGTVVVGSAVQATVWPAAKPGTSVNVGTVAWDSRYVDIADDGTLAYWEPSPSGTTPGHSYLLRDSRRTELPSSGTGPLLSAAVHGFHPGGTFGSQCDYFSVCDGILWNTDSKPTVIPGAYFLHAVNASGVLVGENDARRAAVWVTGQETVLATVPARPNTIDDDGVIGGFTYVNNAYQPVLWRR